jgi:MtN3 and saliva related transmembrane protein
VTCFVLWTAYGILTTAWPIIVANACALVMASGVLFMKWRFRDGDPKEGGGAAT